LEGHVNNITSIAFNAEGKWIVSGSEDGTVKIWDLRNPTAQPRSYENGAAVNDVCIHPNQGELISCDQAGSIKQWDLTDNICSHELTPAGDIPIRSITLASDGTCLVAGNNKGQCYVWKLNEESTGLPRFQAVTRFLAHKKYLTRCLLSPDARYLATCSADTTVKIWSISPMYDFNHEKTLKGHQRWVWDCAFSADSAYLVTASSDHTARLWEMASGETVRQYNGHHKAAVCCALHDGAG
jgi:G protein beta subunit-like protein